MLVLFLLLVSALVFVNVFVSVFVITSLILFLFLLLRLIFSPASSIFVGSDRPDVCEVQDNVVVRALGRTATVANNSHRGNWLHNNRNT